MFWFVVIFTDTMATWLELKPDEINDLLFECEWEENLDDINDEEYIAEGHYRDVYSNFSDLKIEHESHETNATFFINPSSEKWNNYISQDRRRSASYNIQK